MPEKLLTDGELDECRTMWFRDIRTPNASKLDAVIQHAALLGAKKALSDPHATSFAEAMETLNVERYRASELERQYAEAKDALSLDPLTHGEFMQTIRTMREQNANLQAFLAISDEARVAIVERMETMKVWKTNAAKQMLELEREQRHLRSLLGLMQSTMVELESLAAMLSED